MSMFIYEGVRGVYVYRFVYIEEQREFSVLWIAFLFRMCMYAYSCVCVCDYCTLCVCVCDYCTLCVCVCV